MRLVDERKITEAEAVGRCVEEIADAVEANSPEIRRAIESLPLCPRLDDDRSLFEFTLAVLAIQLQGHENRMPAEQAERVRDLMHELCAGVGKGEAAATLALHDHAWRGALHNAEIPTLGLARTLYDRLGFPPVPGSGTFHHRDPQAVQALASLLVRYGELGWWKDFLLAWTLVRTPEPEGTS